MKTKDLLKLRFRNSKGLLLAHLFYCLLTAFLILTFVFSGKLLLETDNKADAPISPNRTLIVHDPFVMNQDLMKHLAVYSDDYASGVLSTLDDQQKFTILPSTILEYFERDFVPLADDETILYGWKNDENKVSFSFLGFNKSFKVRSIEYSKTPYAFVSDAFYDILRKTNTVLKSYFLGFRFPQTTTNIYSITTSYKKNEIGVNYTQAIDFLDGKYSDLAIEDLVSILNEKKIRLTNSSHEEWLSEVVFYPIPDNVCFDIHSQPKACLAIDESLLLEAPTKTYSSILLAKNMNEAIEASKVLDKCHLDYSYDYEYGYRSDIIPAEILVLLTIVLLLLISLIFYVAFNGKEKENNSFLLKKGVKARVLEQASLTTSLVLAALQLIIVNTVLLVMRFGFYHLGTISYLDGWDFLLVNIFPLVILAFSCLIRSRSLKS